MMQEIKMFVNNINMGYAALSILFLIASLLFLYKKKINSIILEMIMILYVSIAWVGFYFLNDIFNSIFSLKFLSVKLYLILLIVGNMIMLVTINFKIKLAYKIANYMLFISNILIFIINLVIFVTNKYDIFNLATIQETSKLIDINFIIFIVYLNFMCFINISTYAYDYLKEKYNLKKYNKSNKKQEQEIIATEEQNLDHNLEPEKPQFSYNGNISNGFFIDGVDCSAIFEDMNKDEVVRNYYILLNDINAKLTNGYTIKEYTKIKNIINKLNIKDFSNINLDINALNSITIDEYNLLKSYLSSQKQALNSKEKEY